MIKGHEQETADLTPAERMVVIPVLQKWLPRYIGKENAITGRRLIRGLVVNHGVTISPPRMRKVINHIRMNGLVPCICASSDGYWVETDRRVASEYLESLKSRIDAQQALYDQLKSQIDRL